MRSSGTSAGSGIYGTTLSDVLRAIGQPAQAQGSIAQLQGSLPNMNYDPEYEYDHLYPNMNYDPDYENPFPELTFPGTTPTSAQGGPGNSYLGGTPGQANDYWFSQNTQGNGNQVSNPDIYYQFQPQSQPTLQDYGNQIGMGLNGWLMNGYMNAPGDIAQQTNDAFREQTNANAQMQFKNNLLSVLSGAFNGMGGGGNGFRDTASRQQAGNGSYTTSIDAGGMNPEVAQGAVSALANSHPGTNNQRGDLRRTMAANSAQNLSRFTDQSYAGQQGAMERSRAGEGQQLAGYQANGQIRDMNNRAGLYGMLAQAAMRNV